MWRTNSQRLRLEGGQCDECGRKYLGNRPVCPDAQLHGMGGGQTDKETNFDTKKIIYSEGYPCGGIVYVDMHPDNGRKAK